jgi:hypothetical protein
MTITVRVETASLALQQQQGQSAKRSNESSTANDLRLSV